MARLPFQCLCLVMLALSVQSLYAQEDSTPLRTERGLVYGKGGDVDLKLDLAMPKEGNGPFPALVCIHGGGWRAGNRDQMAKTIELLARHGYVAVTISYRLVPSAKFPAQIEDCKAAVRWLRAHASDYHLNPDRIGAIGFSAGAHLACLLGTAGKKDDLEGAGGNPDQSSKVQAVASFFGPTDFTTKSWSDDLEKSLLLPFVGASFADRPDLYKKLSPISYISREAPPFLFFHGTEDKLVNIRHSKLMAEKLQEAGVDAKVVVMEGEGHGWSGAKLTQTINQMLAFLDSQLKK